MLCAERFKPFARQANTSTPGIYFGMLDALPFGAFVGRALTCKSGHTYVQWYLKVLMDKIENGKMDPSRLYRHAIDRQ